MCPGGIPWAGARSSGHRRGDATAAPICGGLQGGDVQFPALLLLVERGVDLLV
jgi:hypothetical protein